MEWWQSWEFAQPQWFWLVFAWPVWQVLKRRYFSRFFAEDTHGLPTFFHPLLTRFSQARLGELKFSRPFAGLQKWIQLLQLFILILLLAALAQPQRWTEQPPEMEQKPIRDIRFVVESSVSFVLEDYQIDGQPVSRMTVVKSVLDRFMQQLEQNRFGLTLYAEKAYTLFPLTEDNEVARAYLTLLQPYLAGRTDEAMGEALGLALQDVQTAAVESIQKRVLVLVSDGLQSSSRVSLASIVTFAQYHQIPIYTIGVGAGSEVADQRTLSGLLYQPIETASLTYLAEQTGGRFYQIGGQEDLQAVLQEIEQMETVTSSVSPIAQGHYISLYPYLLIGVLLGLLILYAVNLGGVRWNS
jgi:Ca-activated chloride channel family protein